MSAYSRISKGFKEALILPLDKNSKYILMSDCHRGRGNANDNFLKNEYLYVAAMKFYFRNGFTYLELGDGDELWENRSMTEIKEMHKSSFRVLSEYYKECRMYSLYGNHDMVKKDTKKFQKYMMTCECEKKMCQVSLCPGIKFYEGIILKDKEKERDIYLIHGHQTDALNSTFWKISRFLVRYFWKPLEALGIPDPTSAAKNNTKKKKSEERLTNWAVSNEGILITGHTHHPMAGSGKSPYFNTGSCIHPSGITAIEIEDRCIRLVKWSLQADEKLAIYAKREQMGKKFCLDEETSFAGSTR